MPTTSTYADSKLSRKYQTVIPQKIRQALRLNKGDEIIWTVKKTRGQPVAELYSKPKSWTEYMRGLGKEIWQGVDVNKYIKQLRDEWGKR